eukprot:COSAG02_NODE_41807_length_390_cov_2.027491_1_plen_37_part_10
MRFRSDAACSMHLDLWRRRLRMDRLLDQSNLFSTQNA